MSRPLTVPPLGARYECGGPCANCAEPIVRLHVDGKAAPSRWLHTPNRLECISGLTREPTGAVAEQRPMWLARADADPVRAAQLRMRLRRGAR